ncbi:MAG TPA: hypothetical protein VFK33_12400, partial [Bacillales bacterium]|nr:hypothetical protein [Bacillales bacterium]
MNKSFLAKIGIVIVLLLAFFGYNAYSKWQNSHFKVDAEAFNVKKSFQAVMDDEYQAFPPLKLADHFNLTEAASQTVQIPKRHRQLKIH